MNGGKDGLQDSLQPEVTQWPLFLTFTTCLPTSGHPEPHLPGSGQAGERGAGAGCFSLVLPVDGDRLCLSLQKRKKVKQGDRAEKETGWGEK